MKSTKRIRPVPRSIRDTILQTRIEGFDSGSIGRSILLIHLVLSPLIFSTLTTEGFEFCKTAWLASVALLLTTLGLSTAVVKLSSERPTEGWSAELLTKALAIFRDPLCLGFLLFLLSAAASTVWSISPRTSWYGDRDFSAGLPTVFWYTVLFFSTRVLCRGAEDARRLLAACVIASAVVSTHALLQVLGGEPIVWKDFSEVGSYIRPFATLGHPNYLAGFLAMASPIALYFACRAASNRQWRSASMLGMMNFLIFIILVLALSRGAWIASLAALAVLGIGWARLGKGRQIVISLEIVCLAAAVGLGVLVLLVPPEQGVFASVVNRVEAFFVDERRHYLWQAALAIFRDHPLFGCGLDCFRLAFADKRTVGYALAEWNTTPWKAHNELIHVLATQGLLGLVAVTVLAFGLILEFRRAWSKDSSLERPFLLAILASIVAFFVQDLFGFTVVGTGTLFVTLAGVLGRVGNTIPRSEARPSRTIVRGYSVSLTLAGVFAAILFGYNWTPWTWPVGFRIVVALVVILTVLVLVTRSIMHLESPEKEDGDDAQMTDRSRRWHGPLESPGKRCLVKSALAVIWMAAATIAYEEIVVPVRASATRHQGENLLTRDATRGISLLQRGAEFEPGRPYGWEKLALASQQCARKARPGKEKQAWLLISRQALEHASALVPVSADYHALLGWTLKELAREKLATPAQAFAEYDLALAADRNNPFFYVDAANASLALSDLAHAHYYTDEGMKRYPRFGVLMAHLGYLAFMERKFDVGERLLYRALDKGNWFDQEPARQFAQAMLNGWLRKSSALANPLPPPTLRRD